MNPLKHTRATSHPTSPANGSGHTDTEPSGLHAQIPSLKAPPSNFRQVFQTSDQMKTEFDKFLRTIFYQLDEKKVFAMMDDILNDPSKSDEAIYKELLLKINETKKTLSPLSRLSSLFVLKKGMGKQANTLMQDFNRDKFHNYMEIYDRRYLNTLRKTAKLPLDGDTIAVCNSSKVGLTDKIEAGAVISSYPYKQHEPLNDDDCRDPLLQTEKTYREISDSVKDNSVDLIGCLGGLHHIPEERLDGFIGSLHKKLRPGGVILLRDHQVQDQAGSAKLPRGDMEALVSVVHTFVNAADGVNWKTEKTEVRKFKSVDEWSAMMEKHGFKRVSKDSLVLKDDPTENAMFAFVKEPKTLEDLKATIDYRNDCKRPKIATRASWIEWGNVRFSKQYASHIQAHHAYTFDFVGHVRQHWQHFFAFVKESVKDKEISLKELLFSDSMAMNLFILMATTVQCGTSSLLNLPSQCVARVKYGNKWRTVNNLTRLETFEAQNEKEYSEFIDHTPFYQYDYIGKMKQMWKVVFASKESLGVKLASVISAVSSSIGFIAKAIVCTPVRAFYTSEANLEAETIKILIKDPNNELAGVIQKWEQEKDQTHEKNHNIETIHETPDGYKLISLPRYRPFAKICAHLSETNSLDILEIGNQKEISVDLLVKGEGVMPQVGGAKLVYKMKQLQDRDNRLYATYQVNVCALKQFHKVAGDTIDTIHE